MEIQRPRCITLVVSGRVYDALKALQPMVYATDAGEDTIPICQQAVDGEPVIFSVKSAGKDVLVGGGI